MTESIQFIIGQFHASLADFNREHGSDWWELSRTPSSKYILVPIMTC